MEISSPTPKESTSAKLAKLLRRSTHSVRAIFAAIHQKMLGHPLTARIASRLLGWGLISAGVGVAKWDEYGFALGLFIGGSIVLLLQIYNWQSWQSYRGLWRFLRIVAILGALLMIPAAYLITNAKRGDRPWSDTIARLRKKPIPPKRYISVHFVAHPEVINGQLAFPLSLFSSVHEPWDNVFVQYESQVICNGFFLKMWGH